MKCKFCDKEINENVKFCPNCGKEVKKELKNENVVVKRNKDEETSLLLGAIALICSFFIGILSLPLSIISIVKYNKANKDKKANILGVVLSIISMFISVITTIIFGLIVALIIGVVNAGNTFKDGNNIENKIDKIESSIFDEVSNADVDIWLQNVDNNKIINILTDGNSQKCYDLLDEYEDLEEDNILDAYCFDTSKITKEDLSRIENKIPDLKTSNYPIMVLTNNGKVIGKKSFYVEDEVESIFRNIKYTY